MSEEKITLRDIAGYEEQKEEAKKIINMLKRYEEFSKMGAYIPKGLLLAGPCGLGKTMFAKAISNESGVPLFQFENNETADEEGTIKSLRELFERARAAAPSIIFIDEIDELVSNTSFFSDYSRKTTKVLLTEIDGINSSDGVMVIATTNHRSELPPALLRSGRMDKKIVMPMPDGHSRKEIARLYLDKNPLFKNIDPKDISAKTQDFSCADIKTLINETLIDCLTSGIETITIDDFERIIPVIRFKDIKKNKKTVDERVVVHEVGHFITNYALTGTIGALNVNQYGEILGNHSTELDEDEEEEHDTKSQVVSNLENQISILLAGNIAEIEKFDGDCSMGSSSDIKKAFSLAQDVLNSGKYGYEYFCVFEYRGPVNKTPVGVSKDRVVKREGKVDEIMNAAAERARESIRNNEELFTSLCDALRTKQVLNRKEITKIIETSKGVGKIEDVKQTGLYAYRKETKDE